MLKAFVGLRSMLIRSASAELQIVGYNIAQNVGIRLSSFLESGKCPDNTMS